MMFKRIGMIAVLAVASARAATESYTTLTSNINQIRTEKNNSPPYAGTYDNLGTELAQYANNGSFGNTPGAAAFRTFTTNGGNASATVRTLQHGDKFTITCYVGGNPSSGGRVGIAFRDSTDYADFFKSTDATTEGRFQLDNTGAWKLYGNGGSYDSGSGSAADRTFTITITSENTFNATVAGTSYYDIDMDAGGGSIDSFAIYTFGDANQNSFWKSASLQDMGSLEFGGSNATKVITGGIFDGLAANHGAAVRTNEVLKTGTGTITFNGTNTYGGGTQIRAGTLAIRRDSGLGAVPAAAVTNLILTNSLSAFSTTNNFTIDANRVILLAGPAGNSYFWGVASASTSTYGGNLTGPGHLVKNQDGTLILTNGKTSTGSLFIDRGVVAVSGGTLAGSGIDIGTASAGDTGSAAELWTGIDVTNTITVNTGGGRRMVQGTGGSQRSVSGGITLNNSLVIDGSTDLRITSVIAGTGRVNKAGSGRLTVTANNTLSGGMGISNGTFVANSGTGSAGGSGVVRVVAPGTVTGTGIVSKLSIADGGMLSPGASPGTLTVGDTTFDTNGVYVWEINNFTGTQGGDTGWDWLKSTGTLTIASTVANTFTVRVTSLNFENTAGFASNFNEAVGFTQYIASAVSISGFAANKFALDLSAFSNAFTGGFTIQQIASTNLAIVYAPPTPPGLASGPALLAFTAMLGDTSVIAAQQIGITNVGGSALTATNFVTYGTGSGWLTVTPSTFSLAVAASRTVTATVSAVGLSAGTYYATNRIDGNQSNAAQLVSVTLTVTNIPVPQSVSAVANGPQLVRLSSVESGGRQILVVHRQGSAPSADPSNGTPYSPGDSLGGGTVIYKGAAGFLEHVVAANAAQYYRFYAINNTNYSAAVDVNATTLAFWPNVKIDQASYTQTVALAGLNGGQGWSGAWAVTNKGSGGFTVETNGSTATFAQMPAYPTNYGNRIRMTDQGTSGSTGEAWRTFASISTGRIYAAYLVAYQFNGADKFAGMSFVSNSTERVFFGERAGADKQLGIRYGATEVGSSYGLNDYNADNGNTYLVIASYDFTSRVFRTKAYYRTIAVALAEPTGWDVETTLPSGTMDAVDGVLLRAGGPSGGTVGQVFFDEVRVAQSWADLMGAVAPVLSAYNVNAGADVTDGQIASGAYAVAMEFYDVSGLSNNAATPNFDVLNAAGTQVLTDRTFSAINSFSSGRVVAGTNATQASVGTAGIDLGSYALRWSAVNSNGLTTVNSTVQSNNTALTFTVVDDDTTAPTLSGFVATGTGAGTVTVLQVKNGGWSITGLVQDVGSGINSNGATVSDVAGNISPHFEVLNSTGTVIISSQLFTTVPADGGAQGSAAPLGIASITNMVPLASLPIGVYTVRVTVADNDEDRAVNSERTVLTSGVACSFEVVGAPVLDVSPVSLSFATTVGLDPTPSFESFVVTNAGTAALGYSNVVTYSANGSGWLSVAAATGALATGSAQTHTATVSAASLGRGTYYATNTVYGGEGGTQAVVVTLSVTSLPYIAYGPAALTYHVMLGSGSSNQTFGVTNAGDGVLTYTNVTTYGTGSGWLTLAPATGSLAGAASQVHTASVNGASVTAAGSYVATNAITSAVGTNSPQLVVVTAVVTNIPDPQTVTATADGNELVRLTLAESAGRQVLVVHRAGSAPSSDPVNGTPYSVGASLGGGTVIFKLTGSSTASNLEHIVAAGTTNYYRFYAINSDFYSPGVSASAAVGSYNGAIVDPFAYTNATSLSGLNGGSGWSGAWTITGNSFTSKFNRGAAAVPLFQDMPNYPAFSANRIMASVYASDSEWKARRDFPQISTGKVYAAYVVAIRYQGAGKYTGMRLVSNGVEKVFFGETGASNILGLDGWGGSQQNSAFALNAYDDGGGTDTGNVYLVVGRYDFATRVFDTKAFYRTTSVPKTEPSSWDTTVTLGAGRADAINGIEIVTAGYGGGYPGDVFFDEIRIAPSWGRLMGLTEPVATNYAFNTNNLVSDQQLNGGTFGASFDFYDAIGMSNSAATPNIDVFNPSGTQVITDRVLTAVSHSDAGRALQASVASMPTVDSSAVTLGVYTGRWSAYNSNEVGTVNSTVLSNGTAVTFTVFDDDTNAPVFGTALDGRAMAFQIGATNYGAGTDTGGVFAVTDGELAQVGAANPMKFIFNLFDAGSGIQRSNAGASGTNLNFDIGASGVTNVFATYSNGLSSADSSSAAATSVFYHAGAFSVGGSGATETGEVWRMIQAVTNVVTISGYDVDADRTSDALSMIDRQAGLFVVTDDDTNAPVAELLYVGTNYTFGATNGLAVTDADIAAGGRVDIVYRWYDPSGLFVTNTDLTKTNAFSNQGNVSMNWDLTNSLGQAFGNDILHSVADLYGDNGDAYVTNVLLNIGAASNISLSAWFLTVSAQDLDSDRGTYNPGGSQSGTAVSYDRAVRTNQLLSFSVVDDDVTGPTAPTQSVVVLRGQEWTNNLGVLLEWSSNGVTDVSGISGYRVWTNEAASATSGVDAGSSTTFTWTVTAAEEGVRTNHLFAIDNDVDRTNDYMFGASVTFTTKIDRTPPARVSNFVATIAGVADDSSEIKLLWTGLTNAGIRADGDPLSPWKSYVIFYTTDGTSPSTNGLRLWTDNGHAELGTNTIQELVLSNLNYDTEFRFGIAGLDTAGNYGEVSLIVTQRTGGFVVTQGLVTASSGVVTHWTMRTNLAYDVLYQDATSWSDLLTNGWKLLATVTNSFPEDTGTVSRTAPQGLVNTMRFYRVAGADVWQTNNPIRRASREIYVTKTLTLVPGENWVSLFFEPDNNRVADVLGTNRLPAGETIANATKISWYSAANSAVATSVVWLADSGNWTYSVGGSGPANDKALPLVEGFNIEIPGSATQRLTLVGVLTTNARVHTVGSGAAGTNETFHVRSLQIPRWTSIAQTGLKSSGLVSGINPTVADEIRILSNVGGVGTKVSPAYRIWLRSTDNTWRYTPGNLNAEGHVFEPGQTLIIVRHNAGTATITNALHYTIPGKNINP